MTAKKSKSKAVPATLEVTRQLAPRDRFVVSTHIVPLAPETIPGYVEEMLDIAMKNGMWDSVEFWGEKLKERIK